MRCEGASRKPYMGSVEISAKEEGLSLLYALNAAMSLWFCSVSDNCYVEQFRRRCWGFGAVWDVYLV